MTTDTNENEHEPWLGDPAEPVETLGLDMTLRRPSYAQRFDLPEGWKLAWGCRAIYKLLREPRGKKLDGFNLVASLDILHDRHEMCGGTTSERRAFALWIAQVGIPAIKRLCEESRIEARDGTTVTFTDDDAPYAITASPNSSFGYLYILAWRKVP